MTLIPSLRRRVAVVGALALTILLAACGPRNAQSSLSSSAAKGAIRIGALYPRTGPQEAGGTEEERGVRLAAEWANAHGGVRGKTIELRSVDAPRAEAVAGAMAALRRQGVSVIVGTHGSTMSAAAADAAVTQHALVWETGAVGQLDRAGMKGAGTSFLRLAPMGANLGQAAVDFVHDELASALKAGPDLRYAIAYVDDSYGRAVGLGAVAQVQTRGQTLAGTFPYPAGTADFSNLARQIGAAKPDVLFVSAYLDDGVALRRATVAAHIPLVTSIGTSSSYCMPAFGERLGADAVGLFASDKPDAGHLNPASLAPEGKQALAWVEGRYRALYHDEMPAPALSGFSNAFALFVHVLPQAKSISAADVSRAALVVKLPLGTLANGGGLDLAGPGAPDAGNNRRASSVIWEWVAPGKRAVVWPKAFATQDIVPLTPAR